MTKTIDVSLSQMHFPATCAVCMSPAAKRYQQHKTFTFGRRSYTVRVDVPMCDQHFDAASFKGTAERLIGLVGVVIGIIVGLMSMVILILHWQGTGQGNIVLNLLLGGVVGLGMFLAVWALISLSIASLFADPASKEARNAVQVTHYWPHDKFVRLRFEQEQLAEIVQSMSS
jgi:uncharacterized membrane protein